MNRSEMEKSIKTSSIFWMGLTQPAIWSPERAGSSDTKSVMVGKCDIDLNGIVFCFG